MISVLDQTEHTHEDCHEDSPEVVMDNVKRSLSSCRVSWVFFCLLLCFRPETKSNSRQFGSLENKSESCLSGFVVPHQIYVAYSLLAIDLLSMFFLFSLNSF